MWKFIKEIWSDESDRGSSKRVLGTICVIALVYALITGSSPNTSVVSAVEYIGIACILGASADKTAKFFSSYRKTKSNEQDGSTNQE